MNKNLISSPCEDGRFSSRLVMEVIQRDLTWIPASAGMTKGGYAASGPEYVLKTPVPLDSLKKLAYTRGTKLGTGLDDRRRSDGRSSYWYH